MRPYRNCRRMQESWFSLDHYFSDDAFPGTAPVYGDGSVKKLIDIGGNTGKWAIASAPVQRRYM